LVQDERKGWRVWRQQDISHAVSFDRQYERLWWLTGSVPLLLDRFAQVCESKDTFEDAWNDFALQEGRIIWTSLTEFLDGSPKVPVSAAVTRERLSALSQFLTRSQITGAVLPANYDHRHFFMAEVDDLKEGRKAFHGYPLCGLVEETGAVLLRGHHYDIMDEWVSACRLTQNPTVKGFLAEQIALSAIGKTGIVLGKRRFDPSRQETVIFHTGDEAKSVFRDKLCRLYAPQAFNYKHIDGLSNMYFTEKKEDFVALAAFQMTMESIVAHKESLNFFNSARHNWEKGFPGCKFEWHFVWIVPEAEARKRTQTQTVVHFGVKVKVHVKSFREISPLLDFM
jgi:hypothetical protein